MKAKILVSLITAMFVVGFSGSQVSYAAEFEWGDTMALKEHLNSHVKFPATGKVIKESCKEMPDEISKAQRAYLDSKLNNETTYENMAEVLFGSQSKANGSLTQSKSWGGGVIGRGRPDSRSAM